MSNTQHWPFEQSLYDGNHFNEAFVFVARKVSPGAVLLNDYFVLFQFFPSTLFINHHSYFQCVCVCVCAFYLLFVQDREREREREREKRGDNHQCLLNEINICTDTMFFNANLHLIQITPGKKQFRLIEMMSMLLMMMVFGDEHGALINEFV